MRRASHFGGTQIAPLGFFHFYFPTSPNPAGSEDTIQSGNTLYWAADLRFMVGTYVDLEGQVQRGAFALVRLVWVEQGRWADFF